MDILFSPPLAFLIYLPLVFAIYFLAKDWLEKQILPLRNPACMAAVKKPPHRWLLPDTARSF